MRGLFERYQLTIPQNNILYTNDSPMDSQLISAGSTVITINVLLLLSLSSMNNYMFYQAVYCEMLLLFQRPTGIFINWEIEIYLYN